jgi:hypothetical protein
VGVLGGHEAVRVRTWEPVAGGSAPAIAIASVGLNGKDVQERKDREKEERKKTMCRLETTGHPLAVVVAVVVDVDGVCRTGCGV